MAHESTISQASLPKGISKPLTSINSEDQSGLIAILTAFSLGLILLSIATRIYVRHQFRLYRIDDFTFFVTTIFAIIQTSLVFKELQKGLGKAEDRVHPSAISTIQKFQFVTNLIYLAVLFLSKCCVLFLFLSLTPGRPQVRVIRITIAASVTWIISSIILEAVGCDLRRPWRDNMSTCTDSFARWAVIAVGDAVIELVLVANSIYIVMGLQMPLRSKAIVVGAFMWRIGNIALTSTRLVFLKYSFEASSSHIWDSRVVCTTQLALGYTIITTVIPYLKPFIMAYEPPTACRASYYQSSSSTRVKLSNLTSGSSETASGALATTMGHKDDGALRENGSPNENLGEKEEKRRRRSTLRLGRLRLEQTGHEGMASATEAVRGQEKSENESDDSEQMIIKKGFEWSITYHNDGSIATELGTIVAGTEESRGASPMPDEITAIRTHV